MEQWVREEGPTIITAMFLLQKYIINITTHFGPAMFWVLDLLES